MKRYWPIAALLTLLVTPGCGDRAREGATASDEHAPLAAEQPADAGVPRPAEEQTERAPQGASASAAARRPRPATPPPPSTSEQPSAPAPPAERAAPVDDERAEPAPAIPEWHELTVPAGTALRLELETALSSEHAKVEMPVRARLRQAVVVDGHTALPVGAVFTGHVIDVERAGRVEGRARLAFRFDRIQANDLTETIATSPITFVAEATKTEDATKIAGGAVGGAIVGGILGGGRGAAKGAAIGGAAGTGVVLATRGKEVELATGAEIAASLSAPFTIRAEIR